MRTVRICLVILKDIIRRVDNENKISIGSISFLMPLRSKIGRILFLSCLLSWHFNLAYNFWTVIARDLVFQINISCDKNFPWVLLLLTMWPWPWSLQLLNIECKSLDIREYSLWQDLSVGTIIFLPCHLYLWVCPFFFF